MKHKVGTHRVSYGGGGSSTIVVHGCFEFEGADTNPLLAALPTVIHINGAEGCSCFQATLNYLASETSSELPGSQAVILRLTDVLFIQALRVFMKKEGESRSKKKGLIRASSDVQIGKALSSIHDHPEEKWTQ